MNVITRSILMSRHCKPRILTTIIALTCALAVVSLSGAVSAKADDIAYMGVNGGNFGPIDLNTGVFTLLGS